MISNDGTRHDLAQRVRSMRAQGATYRQIRAELGIGSSTTVSRLLGVAGKSPPRPRITQEVRERARELRRSGQSVPEISRELSIARSTAWLITKDMVWAPGPGGASRRTEAGRRYWRAWNEQREVERDAGRRAAVAEVGELSDRELLLLGAVLYWAEGTKAKPWRKNDERLTFINSDPDVIRLYLAWLTLFGVPPDRVSFRVHIHESADVAAAERYWAGVVGIPPEALARATLKRHSPKTTRKNVGENYRGCLVVQVRKSVAEYWRMNGLWLGIAAAVGRR